MDNKPISIVNHPLENKNNINTITTDIKSPIEVMLATDNKIVEENQNYDKSNKYFKEDMFLLELNKLIVDVGRGDKVDPITRITDNIFMGQGRTTLYAGMLMKLGITHILSVGRPPHGAVKDGKFDRLEITDLPDSSQSNMIKHLPTFFDYIHKVQEQNGRVYIHCEMGCSRSAFVVISILRFLGYSNTLQSAYDMVKSRRPWISMNLSFRDQIKSYFNEPLICS